MPTAPPPNPPAAPRPLRADAARNRTRILAAARQAFAQGGLDVGVEEIARRAGVGKGTLYRRFSTKERLIQAIFEDRLEELERIAAERHAEPDPWAAFARFVGDAARLMAADQAFLDVVAQRTGGALLSPELRRRFHAILGAALTRAQGAGVVRADLVPQDLAMLLRMIGVTTRPAPDGRSMAAHWPRYLGLVLDGVRPQAATALPCEALRPRP